MIFLETQFSLILEDCKVAFLLHSLVDINQLKKGHRVYQNCLSQLATGVTHKSRGLPLLRTSTCWKKNLLHFQDFSSWDTTVLWTVYCSFACIFLHLFWSGLDFYQRVAEMNATKVSSTSSEYCIITLF